MNENPWVTFVGDGYGEALQMALVVLMQVPVDRLAKAIDDINRTEALGPMLDPSAYLDGKRWKNAADYKRVLRAALELRRALPEGEAQP